MIENTEKNATTLRFKIMRCVGGLIEIVRKFLIGLIEKRFQNNAFGHLHFKKINMLPQLNETLLETMTYHLKDKALSLNIDDCMNDFCHYSQIYEN